MKKFFLLVFFVLLANFSFAQTEQGKWELSLSGTLGSFSSSTTSQGQTEDEESIDYFTIALRPGYFIINSLEFEPEIMISAFEGVEPSFSFAGNLAYNFKIPNSNVIPFVLAGYGIGNTIPLINTLFRVTDEMDVSVLNLGAGAKIFVGEQVAVRIEYRYQTFSYEDEGFFTREFTLNSHKLMFGFSYFLP